MSTPQFDAVIAGGGLSGLSLAARLATGGWRDRRVLIVDDTGATPAAVSWGFWSVGPDLLDAAVSHTYRQVRIHAAGRSRVLSLGSYRYQVVRRPDLRRVVLRLLDACPGFAVTSGRVLRLCDAPDGAQTTMIDGRLVRSRWAFDSVTRPPTGAKVDARLAFTGWEVRCDAPVFDPQTPVLFDFRTPQAGGARFVYVLPDDSHRALVELTEFVPRHLGLPAADHGAALAEYLRHVAHAGAYTILRTESAVLPLRTRPPRRDAGHVLTIGARGGLIKASTGYAYQRIQRDSTAIAASLVRHGHPFDLPSQRRRHRLLDAVLLEVLDRDPAQLQRAFARLFAGNPADRVLRFLDEGTGVAEELRLIASLPPAPYLRALFAHGSHAPGT